MSSLSPVVQAVRDAGEKLTGSSNLTREEFLRCVRDLDTALRSPGDDGDDACAEFCAGPPDAPHRAALAWFAGKLRKGVADGGDPMRMREDVFTTAAALQVLVSASGGDHRATFGHTSRDGSHERWPVRGYDLCAKPWPPTVLAPTGILPPLLALTRCKHAGPQVWMRALQLAGSIARSDDAVVHEMARTGWPEVCASVVTANPDPDFTETQSREFVVEREVWQWLDERFQRSGSGTLPESLRPTEPAIVRGHRTVRRGVIDRYGRGRHWTRGARDVGDGLVRETSASHAERRGRRRRAGFRGGGGRRTRRGGVSDGRRGTRGTGCERECAVRRAGARQAPRRGGVHVRLTRVDLL